MKKKSFLFILCCFFIITFSIGTKAEDSTSVYSWNGEGTLSNPYEIQSKADLFELAKYVNQGNDFSGVYFSQSKDINLNSDKWIPIGANDNIFYGTYDGNGHVVSNLLVQTNMQDENAIAGLFGNVGGTIANLEIESGKVSGYHAGAIAAKASSSTALIINCYNKAEVEGVYAGGIADNFAEGVIASCWNDGNVHGDISNGIIAFGGDVKVYACNSKSDSIVPGDVVSTTSHALGYDFVYTPGYAAKYNFKIALAQAIYGNKAHVKLKQITVENNQIIYEDSTKIIDIVEIINYYLLPFIILCIGLVYFVRFSKVGKNEIWNTYKKNISAYAIINGILVIFSDTFILSGKNWNIHIGNLLFLILIHIVFFTAVICVAKHSKLPKFEKENIPLIILIISVVILEVLQFGTLPKYDAALYYGSFIRGVKTFNFDLITYISSFVCWKWMQGLALFLAPFEFILTGKMIGVYIGNICIIVITIIILYKILKIVFKQMSNWMATFTCLCFIFAPYMLGNFTYLSMDSHLCFFTIWFIYAVLKKNNIMTAFCGYLLAFTKITGLFFYVVFLIVYAFCEVISRTEQNFIKKVITWWKWKKIFWWVLPAFLYIPSMIEGDYLTGQSFYGTYVAEQMLKLKTGLALINTLMQSFVYGFRWLILVLFILASIIVVLHKRIKDVFSMQGIKTFVAAMIASLAVVGLLCINNGDAECPRYTSILTVFYTLAIPTVAIVIFKKKYLQKALIGLLGMLLVIQTFWTIDPSIKVNKSIDTGKKQIYKVAFGSDTRPGMNLGGTYGLGLEVMGDVYTYNLEYSMYDSLLQKLLSEINPTEEDNFYVLDILDYELHMCGSYNRNYKIYWNSRLKRRTYDSEDKDSMYLNEHELLSEYLLNTPKGKLDLPKHFYLVVVDRVNSDDAEARLEKEGYTMEKDYLAENIYGKLHMYEFKK